jgi:hypothetical protein
MSLFLWLLKLIQSLGTNAAPVVAAIKQLFSDISAGAPISTIASDIAALVTALGNVIPHAQAHVAVKAYATKAAHDSEVASLKASLGADAVAIEQALGNGFLLNLILAILKLFGIILPTVPTS